MAADGRLWSHESSTSPDDYPRAMAEGVGRLQVMQSNGGMLTARTAAERPLFVVASGRAAGDIAAQRVAEQTATPDLIAFDVGGTTAKASPIEGGRITPEYARREHGLAAVADEASSRHVIQ